MTSQVRYYGGGGMSRSPPSNYIQDYDSRNSGNSQSYHQGGQNSWNESQHFQQNSNQSNNDGVEYRHQPQYTQPSPPAQYHHRPNYPAQNSNNHKVMSQNEHKYSGKNTGKYADEYQYNQRGDSGYDPSQRGTINFPQQNYNENVQRRFEDMSLRDTNQNHRNTYSTEYDNNIRPSYISPSNQRPSQPSNQYQNQRNQPSQPYNEPGFENVRPDRGDSMPVYQHSDTYNEAQRSPTRTAPPQILADVSNDSGGSAAVFGVVANVGSRSAQQPSYQSYHHENDNHGYFGQGSPTRTHPLTPITEHPTAPHFQQQNTQYQQGGNRPFSVRPGDQSNRYYSREQKPQLEQSIRPHNSALDHQRDMHRDTDSSGYGSAHTEHTFDPSIARKQNAYVQDPRGSHNGPISPNEPRSPPGRPNSGKWNSQVFNYDRNGRNEYKEAPQPKPSSHWTLQKGNQPQSYERQQNYNRSRNAEESGVDHRQIKGVKAVKNLFEKRDGNVPLPQVSSSWGANNYRNAAPATTQPHRSPVGSPPTQNQSSYQQPQNYPPHHQSYPSKSPHPNYGRNSQISSPPHPQLSQHPGRYDEPTDNPNRGRWSSSPHVAHNNQDFQSSHNQGASSHGPPPSQSMSNLDLRVKSPPITQNQRGRIDYSENSSDAPMIVGVKFQKEEPLRSPPNQGYRHPPLPSKPPNHPRSASRNNFISTSYHYARSRNDDRAHHVHYEDRRYNSFPEQNQPPQQPSYQQNNQYRQDAGQERPSSDESNYLPSVVARSYRKYSAELSDPNQNPSQEPTTSQPSRNGNQRFQPDRDASNFQQPDYNERTPTYNQKRSQETDFPPNERRNVYRGNFQRQRQERWEEETGPEQWLPQSHQHRDNSNTSRQQQRQPPTGRDSNMGAPKLSVPRHPFDPVEDDESSEGIDVDAPTPPVSGRPQKWGQHRQDDPMYSSQQGQYYNRDQDEDHRPVPAGERFHQDSRHERQPGDGLNDDLYPSTSNQPQQYVQPSNAGRSRPPRKPVRSSLRNKPEEPQMISEETQVSSDESPDWDNHVAQPLNHDLTKDRLRVAKAGRLIARKPPTRMPSADRLTEDFAINVTPNDLMPTQSSASSSSSSVKVEKPAINEPKLEKQVKHSKQSSHKSKPRPNDSHPKKSEPKKDSKLVFKLPTQDYLERNESAPLANIQEPVGNERKKPPTYVGFGNTVKPKSSLGADLLDKFKSAQEGAIRNVHKKQERALKSVQARLGKRTPSPVKSPPPTSAQQNADVIKEVAKHVDYHDNRSRSKSKSQRRRDEDAQHGSRARSRERSVSGGRSRSRDRNLSQKHRGRSRSRERNLSPERRGRSRSRERNLSPERRGRSRSRERSLSPDRRGRSRSRERNLSPQYRGRSRSRDRYISPERPTRDHNSRKSARDHRYHRPVSPYRPARDDPTYRSSRHRGNYRHDNEPDWVEQFRRRRVHDDPQTRQRAWVNDPRWQRSHRDLNMRGYDHEPERKQMFPSKLSSRAPPGRYPPARGEELMRSRRGNHSKRPNRNW